MKLLVSVRSTGEARAALAGGADIIDAKEPSAGALGAVSVPVFRTIRASVPAGIPVTAALGDADDEDGIERLARAFTASGATIVKVGFASITSAARVASLVGAAVGGARAGHPAGRVVAVAYADRSLPNSVDLETATDCAAVAGAAGILVDTAQKSGPGLRQLMTDAALAGWIRRAHGAGLLVAVAGRLTAEDLWCVRDAGADVAGVRGAACGGHRTGVVSASAVHELRARLSMSPCLHDSEAWRHER